MNRLTRKIKYAALTAVLFFAPILSAYGHGEAEWIMADPKHLDANSVHCCGPVDCEKAPLGAITPTKDGLYVELTGQMFPYPSEGPQPSGSYWSIDQEYWWCWAVPFGSSLIQQGFKPSLRCVFMPSPGV